MADPHRRRRQVLWTAAVAVVLGGAAAGSVAALGGDSPTYRTGTVTTGSVVSLLTVSGTAQPVDRSTVAWGASGTVAAVDVALGATVAAGQTLASLTPTQLQRAVTGAQVNLTAAQANLQADEESENSESSDLSASSLTEAGSTGGGQPGTPSGSASATPPGNASGTPTSGTGTVGKAQAQVVSDQQALDTDEQSVTADLTAAQTACGGGGSGSQPATSSAPTTAGGTHTGSPGSGQAGTAPHTATGTTPTRSGSDPNPASAATATGTGTGTGAATSAACTAALHIALAAENKVASDEKALTTAEGALAQDLTAAAAALTTTGHTTGPTGGTRTSSTAHSITPAQLASDQETIDSDQAALIEAQQSRAAADLISPIGGTVVSVGSQVGQSVSAGSSTDAITVVSADAFEATGTLSADQSAQVKVGDSATVEVVGVATPLTGTVTRVGPVNVSGGNTYPLFVSLPTGLKTVFAGTQAQISIRLQRASDVTVVPTPAVHTLGTGTAVVDVVDGGRAKAVPVTVGVVGAVYTQIEHGVRKGQTVVLADMTTPVPASNSTSPFGGVNALSGNTPTFHISGGPGQGFISVKVAPSGR